jgi:putative membrane protein|tara:strand:- start:16477 stop:16785 length:309 start_codon:yes stop_codon:yes gene_type:complete
MRKIAHLLSGFFLILVFVASITFSFFNSTPIIIAFGNWAFPAQPVSVWIIGAFVSGGLIGLLLGMGFLRTMKSKSEIRRLTRQLADAKQEVSQLRTMSLKDQ